jgi:glycosyltransferase involved in cell wall biosynthesis
MLFPFFVIYHRIDLVHVQASDWQVFWEGVAYTILARTLRRPVLFHIHGAFDQFHRASSSYIKRLIAASLQLPQCVIVLSQFAKDCVTRAGRDSGIVVLPNWTKDAPPRVARRPTAYPVFLFIVGTEGIRKGFEEVIEAACILNASYCRARFHFVAMSPRLIRRVEDLKLGNIAKMEGPIEHEQVEQIMLESDAFLLPSRAEGFPISLLEAMAAGLPSIVTPVAAVPEIVADGGALIVPSRDSAALAAAIERLATDADLRRDLGKQAYHTVRSKYTAGKVLCSLAAAYRRLAA